MTIRKNQKAIDGIKEKVLHNIRSFGFNVEKDKNLGKQFILLIVAKYLLILFMQV